MKNNTATTALWDLVLIRQLNTFGYPPSQETRHDVEEEVDRMFEVEEFCVEERK